MSHIYRSDTLEYGDEVQHLEQVGPQIMKIQCLVKDCDDPPKVSLGAEMNDKEFIQFLCQQHFELQTCDQLDYEFRIKCHIIKKQNYKTLKQNKINDLNQAIKTLDIYSCCMRENIKFQNIKTLFTFYTLVSNKDIQLQELVKRLLKEKYFLYYEVKQYLDIIREGQKQLNILQALVQMQKLDNLAKNKVPEATIQASDQINQIQSSIRLSKIQSLDEYDR